MGDGVLIRVTSSGQDSGRSNAAAHGPAGFRCLISALAIGLQVVLFACLRLMDWLPERHLLLWCWVIALDVGMTFGVYGLCLARIWGERILAISLLCLQFLLLWILFLIGVETYRSTHGGQLSLRLFSPSWSMVNVTDECGPVRVI